MYIYIYIAEFSFDSKTEIYFSWKYLTKSNLRTHKTGFLFSDENNLFVHTVEHITLFLKQQKWTSPQKWRHSSCNSYEKRKKRRKGGRRKREKERREGEKEIKKEHSPKFWSTAARFIANAATPSSSWNDSLALLLESVHDRWPCVLLTASYKAICAATRPRLSASSAETEPSGRRHPGRSSEDGVGGRVWSEESAPAMLFWDKLVFRTVDQSHVSQSHVLKLAKTLKSSQGSRQTGNSTQVSAQEGI